MIRASRTADRQNCLHAGIARALQNRVAVFVELRIFQMDV
jgi:hypothetical protein